MCWCRRTAAPPLRSLALLEDITYKTARGPRQPVVICPQGIAAMMLHTGEMQRVGRPQTKVATELRGFDCRIRARSPTAGCGGCRGCRNRRRGHLDIAAGPSSRIVACERAWYLA